MFTFGLFVYIQYEIIVLKYIFVINFFFSNFDNAIYCENKMKIIK